MEAKGQRMTAGDPSSLVDPRALAAALQAAMTPSDADGVYRAVLAEVRQLLPFAVGIVLRCGHNSTEVVGVYPAPIAGIESGVRWPYLDSAERGILSSGEPTLDTELRVASGDVSPLTRLLAFGLRSALRVPLFAGTLVVGVVELFSYASAGFTARDGAALEQYVQALGLRLSSVARRATHSEPTVPGPPPLVATAAEPPTVADVPAIPAPAVEMPPMPGVVSGETSTDRLSVLGELVSGVAHELNNPLTTILGHAQLLPTLDGEDLRRAISTIEQEAQRAGRIVRNLLYFARQHRPRVEPVDLNGVIQRVVEVRRYNLGANNIWLVTQLTPIPGLLGDQYQLEQVFLNLINNAQQAMQPAGGVVTVRTEATPEVARVIVRDEGPGVPEEIMERIFEPFFTTREVGEGAGLGLSIAFGIVEAHGGRLLAQRPPSGGAEFVVELPLSPEAPAPAVAQRGDGAVAGTGERVLVVEDEAAVRSLISTILGTSGYAVRTAESGSEALATLEADEFDLVISDVGMPGLDGERLFERVQTQWPALTRRLLFISGDIEADRFAAMLRERAIRYLEKPFTAAALLRAVREVLDGGALLSAPPFVYVASGAVSYSVSTS